MSQINPHPQYVDGLELRIRELSEQLAALRKDASSKWAFLEWRDRAEKAEAKNATLREALSRLIEVYDAMGGVCGSARIAAEAALAKEEGK